MPDQFSRTEMLLGAAGLARLRRARVAVFGLGGVGGYVVEALARSGLGALELVDNDRISLTNLNRQILATHRTLGQYKTDVAAARVREISPETAVETRRSFFTPETADEFDFTRYDYVVDAVDTMTAKIALVLRCRDAGTPIISCMGTGNKLDPGALEVSDIYQTSVCPLARVLRRELKKRGVERLKVVWSRETPIAPGDAPEKGKAGRPVPGSTAFVPAAAGMLLAAEVVRDLCRDVLPKN